MSETHYRQLKAICNNASVALFLTDENQHCTYLNPAATELAGYTLEDMKGKPLHDVLHHTRPDGTPYPRHECPIDRAYPENDRERGEEVLIHKNGHFINVAYTASPIRDGDDIVGTLLEVQEITDQQRAEHTLQAMSERLGSLDREEQNQFLDDTIANVQGHHIYVWDQHKRFIYANRELEELWGLKPGEYRGKTTAELGYPPHLVARFDKEIDQVLEHGQPLSSEVPYTSPSGRFGYYEYILSPVFDDDGKAVMVAGVSRDTTQRRRLEETLKQTNERLEAKVEEHSRHLRNSEERYRTLFESMDDGFCVIQLITNGNGAVTDYCFLEANPAFSRHTGIENPVGQCVRHLVPDLENVWFETFGRIARTRQAERFTQKAHGLDDRWFELYAFATGSPDEMRVAVVLNDITERVNAEAQLRRAHGLLEGITAGTQDLIAAEDEDFRYLYFNEAYRREFKTLWGRDIEIGQSMVEALAPWPEDQQKARSIWARALAGETFSVTMEFGPAQEKKRIYDLRFNPIRDARGNPIGAAHILRDVTNQVQFQQALRESEERYRLIARSTNDVIWDWNLENNHLEWNTSALSQFGWQPDQLHGDVQVWYDHIHPDDRDRVAKSIYEAIDGGAQSWSDEYRFLNKDGNYSLYFDRGHIAHDPDGRPYRMIGSMLDLTERRHTEAALRRAAEADAFRITLADALRPLADPVEIQTVASRVLGRHLNASRVHYVEISETGDLAFIQAEYRAGVPSVLGMVELDEYSSHGMDELRSGLTLVIADVAADQRLRNAGGDIAGGYSVSAYIIVPLIKDNQLVAGLVVGNGVPREWTEAEVALTEETAERTWAAVERAHVENALRDSEQRFRLLTDGIPHMVWLTDPTGHFEFLNRQFTIYTGAAYQPFEAQEFVERFVHPDDISVTLSAWQQAVERRSAFFVEHRILSASGDYNWFAARAEPHIDFNTDRILRWFGTMTNIQERKLAEKTMREADRQKDEFIAMLAHELRNPLAAVRNVERLLQPMLVDSDEAQRYMQILRRQTGTLSELVEELLDVSRVTRGLVDLKKEPVDLAQIARNAFESVQAVMEEKHHHTVIELPQEPATVVGDAIRLEQILVNLLTNAAKYTDSGGDIRVSLTKHDNTASLTVRDNGIGMTEDEIQRVFTLFGQAERGLDRSQGGLGIGLTIVKNLVELHGGKIEGKSEGLGLGAEFTVHLPLVEGPPLSAYPSAPTESQPALQKSILLVEDSPDVAETMALLLEAYGHRVTVAHDGQRALAEAEDRPFDAILLDIGLPGMDGYEVARCMQHIPKVDTATLVALTGYGQARDRARTEEAGFDAHFVKPVDIAVLQSFLENL